MNPVDWSRWVFDTADEIQYYVVTFCFLEFDLPYV